MKNIKTPIKNICNTSKLIIKYGTILSTILILCAYFSAQYGRQMCETAVYMFSESIISGLLIDVIDKRRS